MPASIADNLMWIILCLLIVEAGGVVFLLLCYKKPQQGQALVRTGLGGRQVSFSGLIIIPLLQRGEFLDITLKRLVVERRGQQALTSKDGQRFDVTAAFFVRVKPDAQAVLKAVQTSGIQGASDPEALHARFGVQFSEALEAVSKRHNFEELNDREKFKDQLMSALGSDMDAYTLDVIAIDRLARQQE
jgi:uncharacterized membrane protein YqiK